MTRELHAETEVQRAESAEQADPEARERGYEKRDAPAGRVALAAGSLFALMLVGLLVAGLLIAYLRSKSPESAPPFAAAPAEPPAPRLLETEVPPLEPPLRTHVPERTAPPAVEAAMRQVEETGWGEDLPAPPPEGMAREHRINAR